MVISYKLYETKPVSMIDLGEIAEHNSDRLIGGVFHYIHVFLLS